MIKYRTFFFSLLLIFLCVVANGCKKEAELGDSTPAVVVDVRVSPITAGSIDETVTASGSTTTQRESEVRSPISGIITRFRFYNGDPVSKGDTIAIIQTKDSYASIQGAERLIHSAVSPSQKDEAEKALILSKESGNNSIITAPYSGILSNKAKNENEIVSESETFASLIDPSSIVFIADVPTAALNKIRKGEEAKIKFPSLQDKIYSGTVNRIDPQLNAADQTAHIQITFSSPSATLQRSLFGEATIIIGRRTNILLAPVAALLRNDENNTTSVMVAGKDSLAHVIDVEVGIRQDSLAQILSKNITAGNLVIVQGHVGLPDSTRIRIIQ